LQAAQLEEQAASKPVLLQRVRWMYESVLRDEPNNADAVAGLARVGKAIQNADETTGNSMESLAQRQAKEASDEMRRAGRLAAADVPVELAALRRAQGRRDEARGALKKIEKPTAESLWIEGLLNARTAGLVAGKPEFQRALEIDPGFTPAAISLVLAAAESG